MIATYSIYQRGVLRESTLLEATAGQRQKTKYLNHVLWKS